MREIVLGPPGTGKTTRLLSLVEQELESGTPPDRIAYVSFTRRAAHEAVQRACEKFGLSPRDLPYFRTLHSLCFHTLGLTRADVMEGARIREFGDWIGLRLSEFRSMDDSTMFGFTEGDRAMFMENLSRVTMTPLRDMYDRNPDGLSWRMVERVSRGLAEFKKAQHVLDFTDMLQMFIDGDWSPPLEVVFVDEAQDLSELQWSVVSQLSRRARRTVVAGDDDQAIYRWAGAAVETFVGLEGTAEVLGQSWRVTPEVQSLGEEIISRVRNRRQKRWAPAEREGSLSRTGEIMSVDLSGPDILVLGRNVFSLRQTAAQLRREGMLYVFRGSPSVSPALAAAVRSWETLRRGTPVSAEECRQVYQLMSSGQGFRRGYKTLPGVPR
jgi:DNA helicase-2/ATP-dependent DNA helicase PcrA